MNKLKNFDLIEYEVFKRYVDINLEFQDEMIDHIFDLKNPNNNFKLSKNENIH